MNSSKGCGRQRPAVATTVLLPAEIHKELRVRSLETGESMSRIVARLVEETAGEVPNDHTDV